jgi:hypothetical protein
MLPDGEMKPDYWYRLFWTTAGPGEGVDLPLRHAVDGDTRDFNVPLVRVPPMVYVRALATSDTSSSSVTYSTP